MKKNQDESEVSIKNLILWLFYGVFIWAGVIFFVQLIRLFVFLWHGDFDLLAATSLSNFGSIGDAFGLITSFAALVTLLLVRKEISDAKEVAKNFQRQAIKKESLEFWKALLGLIPESGRYHQETGFFSYYTYAVYGRPSSLNKLNLLGDEFEKVSPLYVKKERLLFRELLEKLKIKINEGGEKGYNSSKLAEKCTSNEKKIYGDEIKAILEEIRDLIENDE